jgi:predicted nucleic acid-binding protein
MRFWDTSAVVPLLVVQPTSAHARALFEEDPEMVVWWSTYVECASALGRLRRTGYLDGPQETLALRVLDALRAGWHEILPGDQLRARAVRIVRLHPLRAADALQLAAALEWANTPDTETLVSFDRHLANSAELEGMRIAPAP